MMANRNTHTHIQSTPSTTWSIEHGLDSVPVSDVVIGGQKVLPFDVKHIDANNMQIIFATAQAGSARLVGKNVLFAPIGPGSIDFEGGGSGNSNPSTPRVFYFDTFTEATTVDPTLHAPEVGSEYVLFDAFSASDIGEIDGAADVFRISTGAGESAIALSEFVASPSRFEEANIRLTMVLNQPLVDGTSPENYNQSVVFGCTDTVDTEAAMYVSFSRTTDGLVYFVWTPGGTYTVDEIDPAPYTGEITLEVTYEPLNSRTIAKLNNTTIIDEIGTHTTLSTDMVWTFVSVYDIIDNGLGVSSVRFEQLTTSGADYGTDGPGPGGYQP